jgi:hypothetical protein
MFRYECLVGKVTVIARQVWQEFSPRAGEELACGDDGMIEVVTDGVLEGFDIDPDRPPGSLPLTWRTGYRRSSWKAGSRWFRIARSIRPRIRSRAPWSMARRRGFAPGLTALSGT